MGNGSVYWWATRRAQSGGEDGAQRKMDLLRTFQHFALPVRDILERTPDESIVRHDLYDVPLLTTWSAGRVALLGDAAHAPTPNLGQGGAQAIEDAGVVAQSLHRCADPAVGLREYEKIRKPKARRIVRDSWRFGRLAAVGHPVLRALRDGLLRLTPVFVARRQLESIFRVDY